MCIRDRYLYVPPAGFSRNVTAPRSGKFTQSPVAIEIVCGDAGVGSPILLTSTFDVIDDLRYLISFSLADAPSSIGFDQCLITLV